MLMRLKIEQGAIGVWEWQGGAQTPARVKSLIPLPLCPSCELERIECKHLLSSKCHFEEKVAEMGRRRPARIGAKSCRSCSPIDFFLALKNLFFAGSETAVRRRCAFQPVDAAMRKNFVQNLQRLRHHFRCTLPSPPTREILLAHARGARASPLKI